MANTGFKGISVVQTGTAILFDVFWTASGSVTSTGTATLEITELQSDGTLKSYDFSDNTFKTGAITTFEATPTHRQAKNSTVNTGIWTYALSSLGGFTAGGIYYATMRNSTATDNPVQVQKFQYGSAEGDLKTQAVTTGEAMLQTLDLVIRTNTAQAGGTASITLDASASATSNAYRWMRVRILSGTGAGQCETITAYNGTTKAATVSKAWIVQPDNTSVFAIQADIGDVIVSLGTSLGQMQISNGIVQSDLRTILGSALTGTAALISASFSAMYNVVAPVFTTAAVNQTGDSYAIVNHGTNGNAAIKTAVDTVSTAVDAVPTAAEVFAAVLTSQMTEAYAADGTAPTLAQAIFLIQQSLHEFAISGTSRTVKRLDGSTTAAVFTLDSATSPTSTTRSA